MYFKVINEWQLKVDDISTELEASQNEMRNYNSENFRLKACWEEATEQLELMKRENKNLADEIKDLLEQVVELAFLEVSKYLCAVIVRFRINEIIILLKSMILYHSLEKVAAQFMSLTNSEGDCRWIKMSFKKRLRKQKPL